MILKYKLGILSVVRKWSLNYLRQELVSIILWLESLRHSEFFKFKSQMIVISAFAPFHFISFPQGRTCSSNWALLHFLFIRAIDIWLNFCGTLIEIFLSFTSTDTSLETRYIVELSNSAVVKLINTFEGYVTKRFLMIG